MSSRRTTRSATAKGAKTASPKVTKVAKASKATKKTTTKKAGSVSKQLKKESEVKPVETIETSSTVQEIIVKDATIEKAVNALSKWNSSKTEKSEKKDLFEDDDNDIPLFLQVTGKKFFSSSKIIKPRLLKIPHSIHDLEDARVCIFAKDGLFDEEANNKIEEEKEGGSLKNLAKIITVHELKTKYQQYESRRQLLSEFDIFLVDASIANMAPKLLGKIFYGSPKFPLTITVTDNDNKLSFKKFINNFNSAINSIGYMLPAGPNMTFRLGMLGQNINNLKENIQTIVEFLQKFPIRAIQIKLKDSPSLPIYVAEKVYSEEDILDESKPEDSGKVSNEDDNDDLSLYAEGLKELGLSESDANALFGRKKKNISKKPEVKAT